MTKLSEILRENAHKHTQIKHRLCGEGNECCAVGLLGKATGVLDCTTLTEFENTHSPRFIWQQVLEKEGFNPYQTVWVEDEDLELRYVAGVIAMWNDNQGVSFEVIADRLEALGL